MINSLFGVKLLSILVSHLEEKITEISWIFANNKKNKHHKNELKKTARF